MKNLFQQYINSGVETPYKELQCYPCNTGYTKPFHPNLHIFNFKMVSVFHTFIHPFSNVVYTHFNGCCVTRVNPIEKFKRSILHLNRSLHHCSLIDVILESYIHIELQNSLCPGGAFKTSDFFCLKS